MPNAPVYSDSLVEISDSAICFKVYFFPFGAKCVPFSDIEAITTEDPHWWNGQYRIQGTGDLRTWFPLDWHRPERSTLFFASLRGKSRRIGFTVEDAGKVRLILAERHLI